MHATDAVGRTKSNLRRGWDRRGRLRKAGPTKPRWQKPDVQQL